MGKNEKLMLRDFIEEIAGEPIEKAVLYYKSHYEDQGRRNPRDSYEQVLVRRGIPFIPKDKLEVVLDWGEAREFLNFPTHYRHGVITYCEFSGPIWFVVWTPGKIIFPTRVLNGTQIACIARNPNPDFCDVPLTAETPDGNRGMTKADRVLMGFLLEN